MTEKMQEALNNAIKMANSLFKERCACSDGHLPDDLRIVTECASHQFALAKYAHMIREQNERWRTAMIQHEEDLKALEHAFDLLQIEMNVAMHRPNLQPQ